MIFYQPYLWVHIIHEHSNKNEDIEQTSAWEALGRQLPIIAQITQFSHPVLE